MKLFCFPYAGGSSAIYSQWKKYLNTDIELISVELAGRGKRINDRLYANVPEVIEDVYNIVENQLQDEPYAFFGHSMGAMIAYELSQKICNSEITPPFHVFFSGRSAPHISKPDEKKYHLMDADIFKKEVISLGGTPPEFFEYPELMELFLPLLKNDFKLAESDYGVGQIRPLPVDITVFLGEDDDLTQDQCEGWKEHSSSKNSIHYFKGGHFFINDKTEEVINLINKVYLDQNSCV